MVRGFGVWVRFLGSVDGSLDLRGSEAAERKHQSKELCWENTRLIYRPSEPDWETFSWHGMGKVRVCWGGLGREPLVLGLFSTSPGRRLVGGTPHHALEIQLAWGLLVDKEMQVFLNRALCCCPPGSCLGTCCSSSCTWPACLVQETPSALGPEMEGEEE